MKQKRTLKPGLFGLQMVLLTLFGSPTVAHAQDNAARESWKSWEQQLRYDAIYTSDGEYETEMGEDGHKMYHVEVSESVPYIWHAVIYNDIGEVYNYRTVRVAPWAISRQPTLQDISFADCSSNTAGTNAYAWISIDLADACFAGNNNLEGVYMKYKMYAGDDHTIMLKPKDVRPGKNIFWNNIKPKIYVDWEYYQDFINDSKWSEYKYQIVATTSMREAEKTMKGVGYARDHVEDGRGSFKTESGYSKTISYAHVIGASESDIRNVNGDILIYNDYGESAPFIITRIWSHAYDGSSALKSVKFQDVYKGKSYKDMNITIGDAAFANCPNLLTFDLVMKNNDTGGMQELTPANIKIGKHVFDGSPNVQIRVPLAQKAAFEADENWKEYAHLFVPYVEDITKSDFVEDGVRYNYIYDNNGNYATTKVSDSKDGNHTLYHVKAKSVDNVKESIVFYNDIGTAWNYRTMLIDNDALNGRTGVKTVSFADCVSNIAGTNAWVWPTIELGKTSMMNCSSLEELQMKYKMYAGDDHAIMLRPGTVVPQSGFSLEGSPNAKILVDPEYYTSYMNAPEWQGVKDRIVSTPKMREAEFTEYGMQYARDNNEDATGSYKTTTSNNGKTTVYKVHVIGPDADYIKNHDGIAYLYKDIGQTWAYTTTKIWSRSFDGCEDLKSVKIYDIMPSATKNYLDLNIEIGDSAFVNCPNLKFFDVVMNSVDEKDHFEVIHPSQMPIGKDAFAGSPNVRIRVASKVYSEFLNDEKWSQYANLIEPYDFEMADYKEGGALYSMWRTDDGQRFYCSKDSAELEEILEPWAAEFRNFEPYELLGANSGKTLWYTHITGLDDNYLQKHDGELRIYNDIGTSYNFKTLAIDSTSLRGNENIKKIVFEDCASGSANTHTMLKMVIHNGAFKDCKNLKELNMFYLSTEGTNKMKSLTPQDVYIGENVFDGVSDEFRIVVSPETYNDFITDANWSLYKDKIVACDYMPTAEKPIKLDGLTYDYAANSLNTLPTSELVRLQSSWWNAAIIIPEIIIAVVTYGNSSAAQTSAQVTAGAALKGANAAVANATTAVTAAGTKIASYETAIGLISPTVNMNYMGMMAMENMEKYIAAYVKAAASLTAAQAKLASALAAVSAAQNMISPVLLTSMVGLGEEGLANGLGYLTSRITKNFERPTTWMFTCGQWLLRENKHTIYHMYIKDVDDELETAKIYNDIGSAYNYKTVGIGKNAFHNKGKLKTISFTDINSGEMYDQMTITIPDSAFLGCKNLRELNLIMHSDRYDRDLSLTPDNFVVCGKNIFEGCDTLNLKIVVGSDVIDQFLEDPTWSRYKNMFVAKDVPVKVDYDHEGVNYTYSFVNNSLKKQTYLNEHTIEHLNVVGFNPEEIAKNEGEVALFNDIGTYNNYKLDNVLEKSFYGSDDVKGLSFWDLNGGDAYTNLSVLLQDSCFAECKNMEYVNMLYMVTDGSNHAEALSPDSVRLGNGVFDGCDKLKIKMEYTMKNAFLNDSAWAKYKDKFLPSFFMPADEEAADAMDNAGLSYVSPVSSGSWDITSPFSTSWSMMDATLMKDIYEVRSKIAEKQISTFDEFKAFESIGLDLVPSDMFRDQKKLQSVKLPSTVKTIGHSAFRGDSLLVNIEIPDSVTTIEADAFKDCSSLQSVCMQSSVPATLTGAPFSGLPTDFVIYVPDTASVISAYKEKWPEYADHIQSISERRTLKEVTLKEAGTLAEELGLDVTNFWVPINSIATAGYYSISGKYTQYDSLKVSGPMNSRDFAVIRSLGGRTPKHCKIDPCGRLKYLDLTDANIVSDGMEVYHFYSSENYGTFDYYRKTSTNTVGLVMFEKMPYLETLFLPTSATAIEDEMAWQCPSLQRIVFGPNVDDIEEDIIEGSVNLKEMIFLGPPPKSVDKDMFNGKSNYLSVFVRRKYLDDYRKSARFYNGADTVIVTFEDEVAETILYDKRIYTPVDIIGLKGVENLLNGSDIEKFNELMFAFGTTKLGDKSFNGCSKLKEITIPKTVMDISKNAFAGCSSLQTIYMQTDTVPQLAADAFESLPSDFTIYVNPGMEEKFKEGWSQYKDHIFGHRSRQTQIKEVTLTEAGKLAEELGLTLAMKIDDPSNIDYITGNYSQYSALKVSGNINGKDIAVLRMLAGRDEENCEPVSMSRLTYLDLYDANIRTDENKVCYNRSGANDYVEEDDVIPDNMFWKCDNLNTLILPKTAKKINSEAMYDMLYLNKVVVGDSTTYIGNDAFGKCPKLKTIVFLSKEKPEMHKDAFTDAESDQPYHVDNFYVPKGEYAKYVDDFEYTTHTDKINAIYDDDDLFRALGRHLVMTNDDLKLVSDVKGWFDGRSGIKSLKMLANSVVDTLHTGTLGDLANLKYISLPKTLTTVQENVFANNGNLAWADFTRCSEAGASLAANADKLGAAKSTLVYMPSTFGSSEKANVVYGAEGARECARYELTDSRDYEVPMEFTAKAISYDRDFKKRTAPYTTCLPFDCDVPAGCKAYTLSGRSDNALIFTQVADMKGEKPYLIIAEAADAKIEQTSDVKIPVTPLRLPQVNAPGYSMLGTLSYIDNEQAAGMKAYVLQPDAQWHPVSNDGKSNIAPYRAFIQVNGTRASRAIQSWFEDVDGTTGATVLKTIDFDGKERYYDLNGRQLNGAPKHGVYIHNGKKVVGY